MMLLLRVSRRQCSMATNPVCVSVAAAGARAPREEDVRVQRAAVAASRHARREAWAAGEGEGEAGAGADHHHQQQQQQQRVMLWPVQKDKGAAVPPQLAFAQGLVRPEVWGRMGIRPGAGQQEAVLLEMADAALRGDALQVMHAVRERASNGSGSGSGGGRRAVSLREQLLLLHAAVKKGWTEEAQAVLGKLEWEAQNTALVLREATVGHPAAAVATRAVADWTTPESFVAPAEDAFGVLNETAFVHPGPAFDQLSHQLSRRPTATTLNVDGENIDGSDNWTSTTTRAYEKAILAYVVAQRHGDARALWQFVSRTQVAVWAHLPQQEFWFTLFLSLFEDRNWGEALHWEMLMRQAGIKPNHTVQAIMSRACIAVPTRTPLPRNVDNKRWNKRLRRLVKKERFADALKLHESMLERGLDPELTKVQLHRMM